MTTPQDAGRRDLLDAIAELGEAPELSAFLDEGADAPSDTPADATPAEAELSKGEAPAEPEVPAEPSEAADVPEEYWGVSLEGIPAEKRAELIAHFEQQDSTIHKLQARLSAPAEEAPAPEVVPSGPISDEDLLVALGYDPEDQFGVDPKVLMLGRSLLNLEDQVQQLTEAREIEQTQTYWNRSLDELETTYGPLPVDRMGVLKFAVEENVGSPFEAYFKLSAPIKREVESTVAAARREAAKRVESGGLKPSSTVGGEPQITKDMSLHDAVEMAAKAAEKETGRFWKGIFRDDRGA